MQMKVLLVTPWENRWRVSLQRAFENKGHTVRWLTSDSNDEFVKQADIVLSMWADWNLVNIIKVFDGPIFTYVRSYEIYEEMINHVNWDRIKGVFYCSQEVFDMTNDRFKSQLKEKDQYIIPNWIDSEEWKFIDRSKGTKIAIVAQINFKKCFPLALQVMHFLPLQYSLHAIGQIQEPMFVYYINHICNEDGLKGRFFYHGEKKPEEVQDFFKDKHFILSTSIKEGNPMNILEAMACGLKPIVHNWPGAETQFPPQWRFNWVDEVKGIIEGDYNPSEYRKFIEDHHGMGNAETIVEIVTNERLHDV
jgi:glycosyltransferase involved in cell wall biosynthesis